MPFLLDAGDCGSLTDYLRARGLLGRDEAITEAAKAGDGNMNCTVRAFASGRPFIIKQGRPWVEKYPHIAAPPDRSLVEAAFYRVIARTPIADMMPRLVLADSENRVIVLQDLGEGGDLTTLYRRDAPAGHILAGRTLTGDQRASLVLYLRLLHGVRVDPGQAELLANREMRALNHEHLFRFPLQRDNGLALDVITAGLQAAADALKEDSVYVQRVRALGERYLADGTMLVHGDYFPGSWLPRDKGVSVIDPEFCFLGCGEFDFGVMIAHLLLAEQEAGTVNDVEREIPPHYDRALVRGFTGVEIMRRLIGVAQLPLDASADRKRAWLQESRAFVMAA